MCNKPESQSIQNLVSSLTGMEIVEKKKTPQGSTEQRKPETNRLNIKREPSVKAKSFEWNDLVSRISRKDKELGELLIRARCSGLHDSKVLIIDCSDNPEIISVFEGKPDYFKLIQDTIYELCGNIYTVDVGSKTVMQRMMQLDDKKKLLTEKSIVQSVLASSGAKIKNVKLY